MDEGADDIDPTVDDGLGAVLAKMPDFVSRRTPAGVYLYASPACRTLLGYEPDEVEGTSAYDYIHMADFALVTATSDAQLTGSSETRTVTHRMRRREGAYIWCETVSWPVRDESSGELVEIVSVTRDVAWRMHVSQMAPVGMATVGLDGRYLQVNAQLCAFLGRSEGQLLDSTVLDSVHPEDRQVVADQLGTAQQGGRAAFQGERRFVRGDGTTAWGLTHTWMTADRAGNPLFLTSHIVDITNRKRAEEQAAHQALHDGLTGLPNRVLFLDRLGHALDRLRRADTTVVVLFVDLDRFKMVSEGVGHSTGDRLLVAIGRRLRQVLRDTDMVARADATVARFGGDEFMVLCDDLPGDDEAKLIAERVCSTVSGHYPLDDGREVYVSVSVGIATAAGADHPLAAELVRNAEAALYRAKELGRARYEMYDETMREHAVTRLEVDTGLRRSIERDELKLYYQPTIDLTDGHINGMEGLVRWQHPQRGLVSPAQFIPVAEDTGFVVPLGDWALHQACAHLKHWRQDLHIGGELVVSVNLSVRHFFHEELLDVVAHALSAVDLEPNGLCVEITESALMENIERASPNLRGLRNLGVQLAIDDFGTGYSSLQQLKTLPVDIVKIDGSFIAGLGRDAQDDAMVTAMIGMAHALDLTVVAEGVETRNQFEALSELGCDVAQGYYFARPQPLEPVEDLLLRQPAW